jgi:CAAX protease family protein
MTILGLDLYAWTLIVLFAIVGPLRGRVEIANLRRAIERAVPDARRNSYRGTILYQWVATVLLLGAWIVLDRSWSDVGLVPRAAGWQWLAIAASLLATAVLGWQCLRIAKDADKHQKLRDELGHITEFLPHTAAELRRFGWLSLTAGICEEILYRGLLLGALSPVIGLWPAVLLSSVIFGLGHSYQGLSGVLRTGAVGLVLTLVVVFTGSLFVAMVAHALLDLLQGRMIHAALLGRPITREMQVS